MDYSGALALVHVALPDGTQQVVPVAHSPFNIGRIPANDLQLPHEIVSRHHARLLFQGEEIVLIDLNSSNGTIAGGRRLGPSEPYALAYGEEFSIGPYTLHLERPPARRSPLGHVLTDEPLPEEPAEPELRGIPEVPEAPGGDEGEPPGPPATPTRAEGEDGPPYDEAFGLPKTASRYLQYLPPIYQADPFLGRFLLGFEGILAPVEQIVDSFDLYLDPRTAPAFFLDSLAAWLGLTLDEKWPVEKRRAVLAETPELYRRRGTRWGLARHLEIYTGVVPEIEEPEDQPFHFVVRLHVPAGAPVDRATVERIIRANKPAHATYALEIVPPE